MSKCSTNEVNCPECGNPQEYVAWQSINADLDPHLKDKIVTGELFTFTCNKCGKTSPVTYPCLYHHKKARIVIFLTDDEDAVWELNHSLLASGDIFEFQVKQGYIYRSVKTVNELAEKIMIRDMGLDDRILEILKALILIKSGNDGIDMNAIAGLFYYPGKENLHQIVIYFTDGRQTAIPIEESLMEETFQSLKSQIEENTEQGYQSIDVEWVARVIQ